MNDNINIDPSHCRSGTSQSEMDTSRESPTLISKVQSLKLWALTSQPTTSLAQLMPTRLSELNYPSSL